MRTKVILVVLASITLLGCEDRYSEGYQDGYASALVEAERRLEAKVAELEECEEEQTDAYYGGVSDYRSVTTEVCGGGGVNLNGKHISPGKTGCVRVYNDGTIERY